MNKNRTIRFLAAASLTLAITFTTSCSSDDDKSSDEEKPIGTCTYRFGTNGTVCEELYSGLSAKDAEESCKEGYEYWGPGAFKANDNCQEPNINAGELMCPNHEFGMVGIVYVYGAAAQEFDSCAELIYYMTHVLE